MITKASYTDEFGQKGATIVEFAMTAFFFFIVLILIIDLIQFGFRIFSAQFLAERAVRFAIVGNNPTGSVCRASRLTYTRQEVINRARGFGLPTLTAANVNICPLNNPNCGGADPGRPGQFIRVIVNVPAPLFIFQRLYMSSQAPITVQGLAIGKNERFRDC